MATPQIQYAGREYATIRQELLRLVETKYPQYVSAFNDGGIGMLLLELNAFVGDQLNFHLDRMFQETQRDNAKFKSSVFDMARRMGLKIPGRRPSMTVVDFKVSVPPLGDTFDRRYLPIIKSGAQVRGAGRVFETLDDIDFLSPFSYNGVPNLLIEPIFDSESRIIRYNITKRELVINGESRIFPFAVNRSNSVPFLEIFLPSQDVLSVENVIVVPEGIIDGEPTSSDFLNETWRYYEVESLAENHVFVEDINQSPEIRGIKPGKWIEVNQKFMTEYTDRGFMKIIFGSGGLEESQFDSFIRSDSFFANFRRSTALGVIPPANSRIFVRYRIGGGVNSNVGPAILTETGNINLVFTGPDANIQQFVRNSLRVNNPFPAIGGADEPDIELIRKYMSYNFASQNRAVLARDYLNAIMKMPGRFGSPFRVGIREFENKYQIYPLYLDQDGKLRNQSIPQLKENLAEWLSYYKMMNDYVEIIDGRIVNLGIEVYLSKAKEATKSEIAAAVINTVRTYFDIHNKQMNQNIYVGDLLKQIGLISGVINVSSLKIFNKVGDPYSLNEISQAYVNETTREIELIDYTIFGEPMAMFEIKFPERDIAVFFKQ